MTSYVGIEDETYDAIQNMFYTAEQLSNTASTTDLYDQSIKTDNEIHKLKNEILGRAKKISKMKFDQAKTGMKIQLTNDVIAKINDEIIGLVDQIRQYQNAIHAKNDEMMKSIDDFNQIDYVT